MARKTDELSSYRKKQKKINNAKRLQGRISKTNRRRLLLVFVFVILCFGVLIWRLVQINVVHGEQYEKNVLSMLGTDSQTIPYKRGDITDRNGTVLATSEKIYSLILDPYVINYSNDSKAPEYAAELLYKYFGIGKEETASLLKEHYDSRYIVMKKGMEYSEKAPYDEFLKSEDENDEEMAEAVGNGIWFEESYRRIYPYSTLACDVIGFTSDEVTGGTGLWGIENYYNDDLTGTNGRKYSYLDEDTTVSYVTEDPDNGYTVVTTIDSNIQRICEKYIAEFMEDTGAENIAALVMDPNTGEILAMASAPVFDLNDPYDLTVAGYEQEEIDKMEYSEVSELLYSTWKNFCVNDSYEPGSTSKTMTVSYALDKGVVSTSDTFNCMGGLSYDSDTYVSCNSTHGEITLKESVMYSCNVAMMNISDKLGVADFVKMQTLFGLGQQTGIDLPGEESCESLIFTEDNMGPIELWTSSFGQGYNVNMVQLASAFCSIVNGGKYYKPHIVKEIQNDSGSTVEVFDKILVRDTISEETSEFLREALCGVVEEGTGIYGFVPGYKVGGKTGTAEVGVRGSADRLVSFIAAAPIDDPQLVVYVIVDRPHSEYQGYSSYASKIVGSILYETLPYMQIFPTEEITDADLNRFWEYRHKSAKDGDDSAAADEFYDNNLSNGD
ncbi:MAG: penicillin-binding protein 2 [Lachnospiraceae bacterium]|nr:penicillin-binding protein 2 [Lachnospiraceae bacterium]